MRTRRMVGLACLTGLVAAVVGYLQLTVPIASPALDRADALHYWPVALISGLLVLIAAVATGWLSLLSWRRRK